MIRLRGIVLAFAVAGCGANGPSSTKACADLAQARCARMAACSNGVTITRVYGDMATCLAREQLTCTIGQAAAQTGASPIAAEQCAAAVANQSCADLLGNNPPVECINKGLRSAGAPCAFASQCASTYCLNNKTSGCGSCGEAPPSGISCSNENCARQQICTPKTQTCQKVAQLGETCDNTTLICAADLACNIPNGATTSTCITTIGTPDAPCGGTTGGICDGTLGLICLNKKCGPINYAGDGMPCGSFTVGGFGGCANGGNCYTSRGIAQTGEMGVCRAAAADGKACDIVLGPPCLGPARCVISGGGTTGVCTLPSGASCG